MARWQGDWPARANDSRMVELAEKVLEKAKRARY